MRCRRGLVRRGRPGAARAPAVEGRPRARLRLGERAQHPTLARGYLHTAYRPMIDSNGDVPMLQFTQHPDKPFLRLLILHDDERESAYTTGAEQALDQAAQGWTVISVKDDWATVF